MTLSMADISREEFTGWMQSLQASVSGVHEQLEKLNDRTRDAERSIAVLNDRAGPTAGHTAVYGAGSAGLIVSLIEGLKWWLGK